ncbi:MAG TPA: patatin-like phospholipase family protein [Solirubrobacteraceae bacterium]|nr:patatin-like phospholipase family protein [Solirubrobacteraceae bacterium]
MPTAFVLSGGASLGASQVGMLEALYERDIHPDLLVGTSVGAINAAFIASRPPNVQTVRKLKDLWRGLSRGQIFPANPLVAGLGLFGMRDHSVPVGSLRRLLSTYVEMDRLEDARVALHVVAADALSGEEVLLSNGPAMDAILASAAIPGVYPAVPWEAHMLMDGGILNNTPISHAVGLGAERIIVLPAIGCQRLTRVPRGAIAAGIIGLSRALNQRFANDLVQYAGAAEFIVLPAPDGGIMPADFGHAEELVAEGLERARAVLTRRLQRPALRLAA